MGLGERETPFLKGAQRFSRVLSPRAERGLHRNLGQTQLQFLEDILEKRVNVACCGGRTLEAKLSGIFCSMHFSGGSHFGKIWPHLSASC